MLVLWLLILSLCVWAQHESLPIASISFEGIKKTKASYLQRFLKSETDSLIRLDFLEKEVQRLKNLNSVAHAVYRIDTLEGKAHLVYEIEEALTLFPIVNFGGIKGNFWFQLGMTDVNWLGRGVQFTAFYQNNDRRNNFSTYYRIPYIKGSPWGASMSFTRFASVEPLYFEEQTVFYEYRNTSGGLSGIFEIGNAHTVELGVTFFVEDYRKNERHIGEITPGPETLRESKTLGKLLHQVGQLNYHYFYLSGLQNTANIQTVYNFRDNSLFHILLNDTRFFKRIGKTGNLAMRFRFGISTNNNTPFAPFVLDSHVNIRGSGNRIDRGTATLILNVEYRQTVLDIHPFAAQAVVFSDIGTWRNPGGTFSDVVQRENLRHFVGGGLRLIYKKAFNAILRLDYGVDLYDRQQKGLVIGLGQYF